MADEKAPPTPQPQRQGMGILELLVLLIEVAVVAALVYVVMWFLGDVYCTPLGSHRLCCCPLSWG